MGQVVGFSSTKRDGAESRAFMWSSQTGMIDIGTLGGGYAQACAINDAGVVTGSSQTQGMGAMLATHAFIYRQPSPSNQRMQDLGVLGGFFSSGMAINNYNHVVGFSTVKSNNRHVHAFFHDGRSMMDLGTLSGGMADSDYSVALGVNNKDQVVGYTYLPGVGEMPLQQVAFLWNRSGTGTAKMVNLNNLLNETGKGYVLISATAINDYGQIVASAYDIYNGGVRSVLLIPVKQ
jgi:probable HAF family extracellular repeat protein